MSFAAQKRRTAIRRLAVSARRLRASRWIRSASLAMRTASTRASIYTAARAVARTCSRWLAFHSRMYVARFARRSSVISSRLTVDLPEPIRRVGDRGELERQAHGVGLLVHRLGRAG